MSASDPPLCDPRGVRFAAALSTVVLAIVLLTRTAQQGAPHEPRGRPGHRRLGRAEPRHAGIVFVEVDEDTTAYDAGHLPGAVKINWNTELQDPVRRDFVDKARFEKLLSAKGISNDDTVVLYGGNNNWFAAYAYWYFKLYGHEDVKLLDGGRKKWELDGRPLTTDEVPRPADHLHGAGPGHLDPRLPRRGRRRHRHPEPGRRPLPRRVLRQAVRARPPAAGAAAAPRPHPHRDQRAVVQGRQRGRHLQVRRRTRELYGDAGLDDSRTPSPTAASASAPATPGSC